MHLISTLAAGVKGAENGTARIYQRGTATYATLYSSFEGGIHTDSGSEITLDANGGAEVYVNQTVDVEVRAATTGSIIRSFTDGIGSSSIECISSAFTGTDYEDASTGTSKPITLKEVLDLWNTKTGTIDWDVLIGSTQTTLVNAMGILDGFFYNVKSPVYGAKGDATTDDAGAIQAAIDAAEAAGGGVVFFPSGRYRIASALSVTNEIYLFGVGSPVTTIEIDHATASCIGFGAGGSASYRSVIEGLRFVGQQANTGKVIDLSATGPATEIRRCAFGFGTGGSNLQGDYIEVGGTGDVSVVDCDFYMNVAGQHAVDAGAAHVRVRSCKITPLATGGPADGHLSLAGPCSIMDCEFDNSVITSGTATNVQVGANAVITGNIFATDNTSGDMVAIDFEAAGAGEKMVEYGNLFGLGVIPYEMSSGASMERHVLGTRDISYSEVDSNDATLALETDVFGHIRIQRTSGSAVTLNADALIPLNAKLLISVWNNGSGGAYTITWGTGFKADAAPSLPDNEIATFEFVALRGPSDAIAWYQVATGVPTGE